MTSQHGYSCPPPDYPKPYNMFEEQPQSRWVKMLAALPCHILWSALLKGGSRLVVQLAKGFIQHCHHLNIDQVIETPVRVCTMLHQHMLCRAVTAVAAWVTSIAQNCTTFPGVWLLHMQSLCCMCGGAEKQRFMLVSTCKCVSTSGLHSDV